MFELQIPFFRPMWRRITLVAVCLGWSIVEFFTAAPFFGMLFAAMGVYAFWQFFVAAWPEE